MNKAILATVVATVLGVAAYSATNSDTFKEQQNDVVNKVTETTEKAIENTQSEANKFEKTSEASKIAPLKELKEGVHYEVLKKPLNVAPFNGATLTEFFWLGCPHCQNFEPHVQKWKQEIQKEMNFQVVKVPVPGSPRWNMDSKVYYTIKEMGGTGDHVTKMLALYGKEAKENRKLPDLGKIKSYFGELGFDEDKAMEIFNNKKLMKENLKLAESEFLKINQGGVPGFIVNGKYKMKFDAIRSDDDAYQIIRALSHKK